MISDRIRLRMNKLLLRQVDLVRATGASKSTVHGWINGYTIPKGESLLALADVLKVTPRWLLNGDEGEVDSVFDAGGRIKERRQQLGLKQNQLARKIDIAATNISMWESGTTSPKGENLIRLANALKVTPEWILYGGEVEPGNRELVQAEYLTIAVPNVFDTSKKEFLPQSCLRTRNGVLGSLSWVDVKDNAMAPMLKAGYIAFVDMADQKGSDGEIYLIKTKSGYTFRRFQHGVCGVSLTPINREAFSNELVSNDKLKCVSILGRLILHIGMEGKL